MYINRTENRPNRVEGTKKRSGNGEAPASEFVEELESALIVDSVEITNPDKRRQGRNRPPRRREESTEQQQPLPKGLEENNGLNITV